MIMKIVEEINFLEEQIKSLKNLVEDKNNGLDLNDEIRINRKQDGSIVYYTNKLNGNKMVTTI